jgi:tetratricopeptide (TPR) repeat protein
VKHALSLGALALSLSVSAFGCVTAGGQAVGPDAPRRPGTTALEKQKEEADKTAREARFTHALAEMARLDRTQGWTPEACGQVASGFLDTAATPGDALDVEAIFNAGVAYERCHQTDDAKKQFERALALKADFHPAKVHLILMRYRDSGGRDIDQAISELRQAAIVDSRYTNVEALVSLAMLSLTRGKDTANADGPSDRARAIRYLQSALAVDDGYLPAMNGLALYYLDEARSAAGQKAVRSSLSSTLAGRSRSTQAMELAALVCAQAIRKDPSDPVIHNTCGLIQVELGNLGKAAEAFGKARTLRPGFYEAEMNFAAVNLQFRGFTKAEEAYRAVLKSRADDYDAHVGLALSLRGQISEQNADALVDEAAKELEKAKRIAPDRPEAFYNEGILTQAYKARGTGPETEKQLARAQDLFRQFIQKAGSAAEYAEPVKLAGERIHEIDELAIFLRGGSKAAAP